ncbi:MAG: DUF3786 domain-containing protein [Desulfobacterales bacterium]
MARVDDYFNAKKISVEALAKLSLETIADCSGFQKTGDQHLVVPFLNRTYQLQYPEFEFIDTADTHAEVPIQEQVLILHYLSAMKTLSPTGEWIAYREIPGASFYFSAFVQRAIDPLKKVCSAKYCRLAAEKAGENELLGMRDSNFRCFQSLCPAHYL